MLHYSSGARRRPKALGRHVVADESKTTRFSGDRPSPTICSAYPFNKHQVWIVREKGNGRASSMSVWR
jgi:hypothetical protein